MMSTMPEQTQQPSPGRKLPLAVIILVILLVAGWSVWQIVDDWLVQTREGPNPRLHAGVGESLPMLDLQPLTGNRPSIRLDDLGDRVVLLNCWGTWCPPCREELPHMAELRERFAGQRTFELLSVSYPYDRRSDTKSLADTTAALLKRLKVEMPTYHDPRNRTYDALLNVLGIKGSAFPLTVLIDRKGKIRAVWVGYRRGLETEMERCIDDVLNETK